VTGEKGAAEDIDHETFAWKCLALAGERRLCFFRRATGNGSDTRSSRISPRERSIRWKATATRQLNSRLARSFSSLIENLPRREIKFLVSGLQGTARIVIVVAKSRGSSLAPTRRKSLFSIT